MMQHLQQDGKLQFCILANNLPENSSWRKKAGHQDLQGICSGTCLSDDGDHSMLPPLNTTLFVVPSQSLCCHLRITAVSGGFSGWKKHLADVFSLVVWARIITSWWFQPIWKICSSKWESSPNRDENKKSLKPTPSCYCELTMCKQKLPKELWAQDYLLDLPDYYILFVGGPNLNLHLPLESK